MNDKKKKISKKCWFYIHLISCLKIMIKYFKINLTSINAKFNNLSKYVYLVRQICENNVPLVIQAWNLAHC